MTSALLRTAVHQLAIPELLERIYNRTDIFFRHICGAIRLIPFQINLLHKVQSDNIL